MNVWAKHTIQVPILQRLPFSNSNGLNILGNSLERVWIRNEQESRKLIWTVQQRDKHTISFWRCRDCWRHNSWMNFCNTNWLRWPWGPGGGCWEWQRCRQLDIGKIGHRLGSCSLVRNSRNTPIPQCGLQVFYHRPCQKQKQSWISGTRSMNKMSSSTQCQPPKRETTWWGHHIHMPDRGFNVWDLT